MRLLSPLVLHIGHVQCALATGGSFYKKSKGKIDVTFFQKYAAAIKDTGLREESELFTNNSKI